MKPAPNYRRWIVPAAWVATAAAAFSIGRMSSWLEEPIAPNGQTAAVHGNSTSGGSSDNSSGSSELRPGFSISSSDESRPTLSIGEVTGGQPLEDWLKKLMAQDDDIYRMQHFVKLFDALNNVEDIKMALKVMTPNGRGRGMRFTEYAMLLQKLTQMDPKQAIDYAAGQNGGERWMATGTVLRTWAKSSPEAALAWAKENGTPQNANDDGNGGPQNDNWALASVVTQMGKTNLDRALQEASSAEMGRTAGRTAEALLNDAIDQRGEDAAKKIAEGLPEGQFRNDFIQQLAGKLAATDPAGASDWALKMPTGESKRRALGQTVEQWLNKDQSKAIVFVSALPVGPDSDSARSQVAQKVAQTNMTESLKAVNSITDPQRLSRTVYEVARDLARKDVATGQQYVAGSTLPEDAKATMSQQIAQPRNGGNDGRRQFGGPGGGGNVGGRRN